jgi:hypothetical protein
MNPYADDPLPDPAELERTALALDDEEDLFNFDELLSETQKAALVLVEELDTAPAASAEPTPAAPAAQSAPPAQALPDPSAPLPTPPPAATIVHQRLSITPVAVLVLAVVVLVNLGLALVSWRSVSSVQELVLGMGNEVIETTQAIRDETSERAQRFESQARPIVSPSSEGAATLEQARRWFDQGEFRRARQSLYGLLAVIDRVDAAVRPDLEARARFLIADSYRFEADWLEARGFGADGEVQR